MSNCASLESINFISVFRSDKVLLILTERSACSLPKFSSELWLSNGRISIFGLISEISVAEIISSLLKKIEKYVIAAEAIKINTASPNILRFFNPDWGLNFRFCLGSSMTS